MSLAINEIEPVTIIDPIIDLNEKVHYGILRSGNRHTYKTFVSTSYSNSSAVFSAPPPNQKIILDRLIYLKQPVTIAFTGTAADQSLLLSGYDAFRAYPLSSCIETLEVDINDVTLSINMADVIKPLLQYHNNCRKLGERLQSMTPTQMDQSQTYDQLANSNRNPLNSYVDGVDGAYMGRGAFPMTVSSNGAASASITATLTEPLMISPLMFGMNDNQDGFVGVQTFTCTVNWKNDLSYMWSHSDAGGGTLTDITVTLGQPSLLFHYITPPITMNISPMNQYPLLIIDRYPTDANAAVAAGGSTTLSSSNINLNSIPRMMYIFARKRNSDLTFTDTDSYFGIDSISVNWNNNAGLLSEASKQRLYQISVKNGVNMNWMQWSAEPSHYLGNGVDNSIGGTGSILALEFGTDIGLRDDEAPGLLGNYQLQLDLEVTNRSPDSITPTLYIITHSEGVFTIDNARSFKQIGILTKDDILTAEPMATINYSDLKYMSGSAINWSALASKARKIYDEVAPHYEQLWDCAKLAKNIGRDVIDIASGNRPQEEEVVEENPSLSEDIGAQGSALVGARMFQRRLMHRYYWLPNSEIQSARFRRGVWTTSEARRWLKKHKLVPMKRVDISKNYLRYRIKPPSEFTHFRTKNLNNNMELVIGFRN